jgi:hypothetical protein
MTSNDFFLHQYYFSNEFSTAGAQYDFDTNGTVDAADKAIFDRVANYLKVNS